MTRALFALEACRFCGDTFPTFVISDHWPLCPGTPLARAEAALLTSWVAAARDLREAPPDDFSDAVWEAVAECVRRVDPDSLDWGITSDVLDEWLFRLLAPDFVRLYLLGTDTYEDIGEDLPAELVEDRRRAPVRSCVQLGLMALVTEELGVELGGP